MDKNTSTKRKEGISLITKEHIQETMGRMQRSIRPEGKFDSGGRWYPSDVEICSCCNSIRSPSRAYPYNLLKHCSTVNHMAVKLNVDITELRKAINSLPENCLKRHKVTDKKCESCSNRFNCWTGNND